MTADLSRRSFLARCAAGAAALTPLAAAGLSANDPAADPHKALVAITLDLEMSRNFPTWDRTEWDYEKGNLNAETKRYAVEACRRVKAAGGVLHCFCVGRVLEQPDVEWLKGIVRDGHPVGNHTYDHVYVLATKPEDIQFRFKRAPWLIAGKSPRDVIAENIRLCSAALKSRIGINPDGFRTPGGFSGGLRTRPDVQRIVLDQGFPWVSSHYPQHPIGKPGEAPGPDVYDAIVKAQAAAQPFVYPTGLIEVPMNPISDIGAFRGGRWPRDAFLKATRLAVDWAIEHRAVFDFLSHPSCLYVTDPQFKAIDLICERVAASHGRAVIVGLDTIARRAKLRADKDARRPG